MNFLEVFETINIQHTDKQGDLAFNLLKGTSRRWQKLTNQSNNAGKCIWQRESGHERLNVIQIQHNLLVSGGDPASWCTIC